MTFFDKKEEILEIKLTSYGKHLLSKGKYKPKYYAFFDKDILYDSQWANFSESSGASELRIQDETPSLRPQTSFTDLGVRVRQQRPYDMHFETIVYDEKIFEDKRNSATSMAPLGNSDLGNKNLPSWNVTFLKNEISGSKVFPIQGNTVNNSPIINVPLIKVAHTSSIGIKEADFCGPINPVNNDYVHVFQDKTYFNIDDDFILLEVKEMNAPFSRDSFKVEVFEYTHEQIRVGAKHQMAVSDANPCVITSANHGLEDDEIIYLYNHTGFAISDGLYEVVKVDDDSFQVKPQGKTSKISTLAELGATAVSYRRTEITLKPKVFRKELQYVKNDLLVSEKEIEEQMQNYALEADSNYVEYWFDIRFDNGIDNETKRDYINPRKQAGTRFKETVEHENYSQSPGKQLYNEEDFVPDEDC